MNRRVYLIGRDAGLNGYEYLNLYPAGSVDSEEFERGYTDGRQRLNQDTGPKPRYRATLLGSFEEGIWDTVENKRVSLEAVVNMLNRLVELTAEKSVPA